MAQGTDLDPTQPAPATTPSGVAAETERVLSLHGPERERHLLASDRLAAIVPRLPPQELFFTLSGMSSENLPSVLAHARTEQLEFLLDLDLWNKDRIRGERIAPWLQVLDTCGARALSRWLKELELADLTLLLGQLVQVRVASEDDDPLQDTPGRAPFSLDGMYYVITEEERESLVRSLLMATRAVSQELYVKLMEALVRDVNSELEEHCYEIRQRRLALHGLPEWEEAMEVYARLEAESWEELPQRAETRPADGAHSVPVSSYALALSGSEPNHLSRTLAALPADTDLGALGTDLAWLINKVAVADGLDLSRADSFETTVRKVAGYVSIGLQSLCGDDLQRSGSALRKCWAQHLFRAGWTRIRRLRTRARRFFDAGWPQGHKERLLFLDAPLPQVMEGLLRRHPLRYDATSGTSYALFDSMEQVNAAEWALDKSEFLGHFLLNLVDLRLGDLREALLRLDGENLKGSTVFLTSLVNAALNREFRFAPLEKEIVREGLGPIWEQDRPPRRVKASLKSSAVEWAESVIPLSEKQEAFLVEFVADCFQLLEEEFGHLAPNEVPDPRFTRGVWIE